jgi:hypothetical protein
MIHCTHYFLGMGIISILLVVYQAFKKHLDIRCIVIHILQNYTAFDHGKRSILASRAWAPGIQGLTEGTETLKCCLKLLNGLLDDNEPSFQASIMELWLSKYDLFLKLTKGFHNEGQSLDTAIVVPIFLFIQRISSMGLSRFVWMKQCMSSKCFLF